MYTDVLYMCVFTHYGLASFSTPG